MLSVVISLCRDHLLPGDLGGWAMRESRAPVDALDPELGAASRPHGLSLSCPQGITGPWAPGVLLGWGPMPARQQKGLQPSSLAELG